MAEFDFEIDELEIAVSEGVTVSINPTLKVFCSTSYGDISVDCIEARTDQKTWVRIDDLPQFKAWEDAVKLVAPFHAPNIEHGTDANKEHRLLARELV